MSIMTKLNYCKKLAEKSYTEHYYGSYIYTVYTTKHRAIHNYLNFEEKYCSFLSNYQLLTDRIRTRHCPS
ncbi:hypothetical protein BpHYR1_035986 [Brachionus plicatilis]|uniref:Uncharacterized protein n=1 Tax=Brachionus plicatilis TaxID=10195 RepID=A0A3M7QPM7_BRAPC|nr:hypothetical protein BpHYR1_035986 [Brachionus plicatilis]